MNLIYQLFEQNPALLILLVALAIIELIILRKRLRKL